MGMIMMALLLFGWAISWKISGDNLPLNQAAYIVWAVSTFCGFFAGVVGGIVITRK